MRCAPSRFARATLRWPTHHRHRDCGCRRYNTQRGSPNMAASRKGKSRVGSPTRTSRAADKVDPLSRLAVLRPSEHGGYGWIRDLPDARDFLYAAPLVRYPQGLPPSVDLRSECPPVYDQGQLGSCTANGIAGAIEFETSASRVRRESLRPVCSSTTTSAQWRGRSIRTAARRCAIGSR